MTLKPGKVRGAAIVTAVVSGVLAARPALAFKAAGHDAATSDALEGVKTADLDAVRAANRCVDWTTFGADSRHFNDCGFEVAADFIRVSYSDLDVALATGDRQEALRTLGEIFHAVQDFYSHSNWSDTAAIKIVTDLAPDGGDGRDWPLMPAEGFQGVVLIGSDLPGWSLERTGRRVKAISRAGTEMSGVISGAVAGSSRCPGRVVVGHWDSKAEHDGLSKDQPDQPGYERALAFAIGQSRREICRVLQRTRDNGPARATLTSFYESGLDALEKHCAERWWTKTRGMNDEPPITFDEPKGSSNSVYQRAHLGVNPAARYAPARGWTGAVTVDLRMRYLGVSAQHDGASPILGAVSWAPLGREMGIFVEAGGGLSRVTSNQTEAKPAFTGTVALEIDPQANALKGLFLAARVAASVIEGKDQNDAWARAAAFYFGLRVGLPL